MNSHYKLAAVSTITGTATEAITEHQVLTSADVVAAAAELGVGRGGTVSTAPMEVVVPLMGPSRPRGKKPPVPFWLPSTVMLMTCAATSCCQNLETVTGQTASPCRYDFASMS